MSYKRAGKKGTIIILVLIIFSFNAFSTFAAGQKEAAKRKQGPFDVAIFVPGVVAGSPLYEQLVSGAKKVAGELSNVTIKVVEGGFNQAEWQEKVTSLAATGQYELILTSNPAMPFICAEVAKSFPNQKFLNVDGYLAGNPQIHTVLYNQVEEGYFVGYLAGLITKSNMPGATPELKVGMIVGQQYPALDKMIRPGFEKGLHAVDPNISLDFRVVGNWYDANKASELANSMFDAGVDVILPIAGGANQGAIKAAKERGKYIVYFDSNEYKLSPGVIVGCSILKQEQVVYERLKAAVQGKLKYGEAEILGAKEGYVDFADSDPLYVKSVPKEIRDKVSAMIEKFRKGQIVLEVPEL